MVVFPEIIPGFKGRVLTETAKFPKDVVVQTLPIVRLTFPLIVPNNTDIDGVPCPL